MDERLAYKTTHHLAVLTAKMQQAHTTPTFVTKALHSNVIDLMACLIHVPCSIQKAQRIWPLGANGAFGWQSHPMVRLG